MGRLFGTDGIRGIANKELDCELALKVGRSAAVVLSEETHKAPVVVLGSDTRISSKMLEYALEAGLCSVGATVIKLGYIATPAVAFLTKLYKADAGIMISASHNSFEYNGIKIFNSEGFKLADTLEDEIEDLILGVKPMEALPTHEKLGSSKLNENGLEDYIKHIISSSECGLKGLKIALDCANGSASVSAEDLFTRLGAECMMLSNTPNGININDKCGSTHLESLIDFVKNNECDCGIAFDGDADRVLFVDENGEELDGDFVMAICSLDLKERNKLTNNTMVGTVMSNLGLIKFCEENEINFESTKVGDRYVLECMVEKDFNFGGEQSGHIIFKDYATTGDGQLTAVHLLEILKRSGKKLSELKTVMNKFPQILVNINASYKAKNIFNTSKKIKNEIDRVNIVLATSGRIVVRASGTEPLIRVMVEGENKEEIVTIANDMVEFIKGEIGN